MNMQQHLGLLYRSLKKNTSLEHLNLANNAIFEYKYLNKLILKNKDLHTLDIRGNYMNEDILEQLWSNLHDNIELVDLQFDSQDIVLEDVAIESVRLELDINR